MTTETELLEPARAAVSRALAQGHGDALLASAILKFNTADTSGGAADLAEALVRAPMSASVHEYLGKLLLEVDQVERGRNHLSTAIGLDPGRTLLIMTDLARIDALFGDVPAAFKKLSLLEANPDGSLAQVARVFRTRIEEAWTGIHNKMIGLQRLSARLGGYAERLAQILQVASEGQAVDTVAWNESIPLWVHDVRPTRLVTLVLQMLAEHAAMYGADEQVFSALDQSCKAGLIDLTWMDRCPLFERFPR